MQRYYSNVYSHFGGSRKGVEWHNVREPSDLTDKGEPQPPSDAVVGDAQINSSIK